MKKTFKILTLLISTLMVFSFLAACDFLIQLPAHKHLYAEMIATDNYLKSEATCKSKAVYYYSCKCGEKGTETFETGKKSSHAYENGKCKWCEKDESAIHTHIYDKQVVESKYLKSEATCEKKAVYWLSCECGEKGTETFESGEFAEHEYITLKKTSTEHWYECVCGDKSGIEEHKGGTATCSEKAKCSVCSTEYGEANGHDYNATITEPTCTEQGFTTHTCSCGDSYVDTYVNALEHNYRKTDKVIYCTLSGEYQLYKCSLCSKEKQELINTKAEVGNIPDVHNELSEGDRCEHCGGEILAKNGDSLVIKLGDIHQVEHYTGTTVAFSAYASVICSAYISNNVTTIGNGSFNNYTALAEVKVPQSVTSIAVAFSGCNLLKKVNYLGTIDEWAQIKFGAYNSNPIYYTKDLYVRGELVTEVKLTTATKISNYAFYYCQSITKAEIFDSVTSIGYYAFCDCASLTSVTIGNGVTSIDGYAFGFCDLLKNITFGNNGQLTNIGYDAFFSCNSLTNIEIPSSVTSIGSAAFSECTSLTSITFGENSQLTRIYYEAFRNCISLTSITIPSSVTSIESSALINCYSLTSVTIPSSVTSIGDKAFEGCWKLVEVINKSGLNIKKGSLDYGSISRYALYVHDGESKIINKNDYQFITYAGVNYLLGYVGNFVDLILPENYNGECYEIYKCAFYYSAYYRSLKSIEIPDSVTSIGYKAFYFCRTLTSVTIGNGVTSIGAYAFYGSGCTSIEFSDTSTWYRTNDSNQTGGTQMSVTNSSTNVTYFMSSYCSDWWYKV